jgi:hypothetical protein
LREGERLKAPVKYILTAVISALAGAAIIVALIFITHGAIFESAFGIGQQSDLGVGDIPVDATDAELASFSYTILSYLKGGDFKALSGISHPEYGIVFSPYATITLATSKCFLPAQISVFADNNDAYVWGVYCDSGEPIELTPADYFDRFVFDRDFTRAKEIGIDYVVKSGNALENITDVFPNVRFIDFHIPEDGKNVEGGWSSLRLGFEEYKDCLMLTVIVHSEYTV